MKKKDIAIGVVGLTLLGTTVAGLSGWYLEHQRVADLESQLADAQQQEQEKPQAQDLPEKPTQEQEAKKEYPVITAQETQEAQEKPTQDNYITCADRDAGRRQKGAEKATPAKRRKATPTQGSRRKSAVCASAGRKAAGSGGGGSGSEETPHAPRPTPCASEKIRTGDEQSRDGRDKKALSASSALSAKIIFLLQKSLTGYLHICYIYYGSYMLQRRETNNVRTQKETGIHHAGSLHQRQYGEP